MLEFTEEKKNFADLYCRGWHGRARENTSVGERLTLCLSQPKSYRFFPQLSMKALSSAFAFSEGDGAVPSASQWLIGCMGNAAVPCWERTGEKAVPLALPYSSPLVTLLCRPNPDCASTSPSEHPQHLGILDDFLTKTYIWLPVPECFQYLFLLEKTKIFFFFNVFILIVSSVSLG